MPPLPITSLFSGDTDAGQQWFSLAVDGSVLLEFGFSDFFRRHCFRPECGGGWIRRLDHLLQGVLPGANGVLDAAGSVNGGISDRRPDPVCIRQLCMG